MTELPPVRPVVTEADRLLVKAAGKLCVYVKSLEEIAAGNRGFVRAEKALGAGPGPSCP